MNAADRVNDGGAGEVMEGPGEVVQPAVRAPGPVAEDRVEEAADADAVPEVAPEAGAAEHGARGDRRAGVGERELEEEERERRDAGRAS
jgi:hypothetical protein